ncbi:DUF998 domain-containing protein [Microbacterium halophytorum]|uniref:DUF998 domain-containing protein n=1 Tax=Microbacterium halophytorum TaxID=2067568 RepID=UPI000CFB9BF9|nr:DUF998 domain-containing protein [Microbacterium halophytorum]
MDSEVARRVRGQVRTLWATVACFIAGALLGPLAAGGSVRPIAGDGSVTLPVAVVAGVIAAAAFAVSARVHRTGETRPMPGWQTAVSHISTVAVAVAVAGVTGIGVLLAGEVLAAGLHGIELSAFGTALLAGAAAAVGGRLAFRIGIRLDTRDLAELLFVFIVVGALFAMITAASPEWWGRSLSRLGVGPGGWAFNGSLVVAGLLIATIGAYIGRDLHRMHGDAALPRIAACVVAWAATGAALAAVGLLPLDAVPVAHIVAAFAALALLVAAVLVTTAAAGRLPVLRGATIGLVALVALAIVLTFVAGVFSVTGLEVVVVALVLLWLSTLVRLLGVLAPEASRASGRRSLLP